MDFIKAYLIFGLIGAVIPYTLTDWQWWAWDAALIVAIWMHADAWMTRNR